MATPAFRDAHFVVGSGNPLSVNIPDGLAVGDLMVYGLLQDAAYASGSPASFTQLFQSGADTHRVTVWTKTCVQGDIDAGVVTVANTGAVHLLGALYAVSTPGAVEYSDYKYGASLQISVTGFTPAVTGDLLIAFNEYQGDATPSVFATTNNNPSWTSDYASTPWWGYVCSHATYTTGITGAITSTSNFNYGQVLGLVAVRSPAAASPDRSSLIQFGIC
jgi:hypothetical protein